MESYLQPIRKTAIGILDNAKAWDGGLFGFAADNNLIEGLMTSNNSSNSSATDLKKLLVKDAVSSVFSGGLLAALIFTVILALLYFILAIYTCVKGVNSFQFASKFMVGNKMKKKVKHLDNCLPISVKLLIGLLVFAVFILAFVPLILSFATSSRLHAVINSDNLNQSANGKTDSIPEDLNYIFDQLDAFLDNVVPEARILIQPVVNRTLEMTMDMKEVSQAAYQGAFREHIGATDLIAASSSLIDDIELFYNNGETFPDDADNFVFYGTRLIGAKNYKDFRLQNKEQCDAKLGEFMCIKHQEELNQTRNDVANFKNQTIFTKLESEVKAIESNLTSLNSVLKVSKKTPDVMRKQKADKEKVSEEFNKNISSVFDRELNSTAFILDLLNNKLDSTEEKVQNAREKLKARKPSLFQRYSQSTSKLEGIRFAVTFIVLFILLLLLAAFSTGILLYLCKPQLFGAAGNARLLWLVSFAYVIYGLALLFVYANFAASGYLETEVCRYFAENPSGNSPIAIDAKLLPQINKLISEMKEEAANDPNKTDSIPLKRIDSLFGALKEGCQRNEPLLKAMKSTKYIDPKAGNDPNASLNFKLKGLRILHREMMKANLSALRDEKMKDEMTQFKGIVSGFKQVRFFELHEILEGFAPVSMAINDSSVILKDMNTVIKANLSAETGHLFYRFAEDNIEASDNNLGAISNVLGFIQKYSLPLTRMDKVKNMSDLIDVIIVNADRMDGFLANQTLWTETAKDYYSEFVVDKSTNQSEAISDYSAVGILSSIGKCKPIASIIDRAVGIPCKKVLYPLIILWYTMGWCIFFLFFLTLIFHIMISNLVFLSDVDCLNNYKLRDDTTGHTVGSNGVSVQLEAKNKAEVEGLLTTKEQKV